MSWLDDVGKVIPIAELYRDFAQPATREVGEALGNAAKVARFALAPIDYLAAQHQRWKRYWASPDFSDGLLSLRSVVRTPSG